MKAATFTSYGPPEVVLVKEIPKPKPGKKDVIIKIHFAALSRTDCGFRSANYFISRFFSGLFKPKFPVLGCGFAGEIVEMGEAVTSFSVGDRVFGFDDEKFGGHAAYKSISETAAICKLPQSIDFATAAAMSEGANYAYCSIKAAKVQPGQKVLVNGGTGAIGSAAIQICKYFGTEVVAVCKGEHFSLVRELGANQLIDYQKEDFIELSEKFDLVFDAVGKSTFGKCEKILKPKGIYISTELGPRYENPFLAIWKSFSKGRRVLFPIPFTTKEVLAFIRDLAEQSVFQPLIDRVYPLEEIVEAYHYVETGEKIGNVLIEVQ